MSIGQHSGMVGELIDEVELDKGKLGVNYMDLSRLRQFNTTPPEKKARGALITDYNGWA